MSLEVDFIGDILGRVLDVLSRGASFSADHARAIEQDIRRDWGGDKVYIGKTAEDSRAEISRRNAAILRDMIAGERAGLIARRYGISRRMVYKLWAAYLEKV